REEEHVKPEGFWREFFLLPPDKASLLRILEELSADELLHYQAHSRLLFSRAVAQIKSGTAPSDEVALDVSSSEPAPHLYPLTNQTLTAFLGGVLTKRYTNPSSDIIAVLAGLTEVDVVLTEFVNSLDLTIRNGKNSQWVIVLSAPAKLIQRTVVARQKAIEVALSLTSGAYQTGLVSYLTHRDLFPSLMKYVHDIDTHDRAFEPFLLLGLLANYNKFEFQNPYRLRLDDFVNESTIQKIVRSIGATCSSARDKYVAVQEDLPEGWNLSSALTYLGLGAFTPGAKTPPPTVNAEDAQERFAVLPGPEAAVLLATYDFTNANKLFDFNLVTLPTEHKHQESPFGGFLSFTSYLLHHAYRSSRASLYANLNLFILRILVEDQVLCKLLCDGEGKTSVRLCRQRLPYLPLAYGDRILATVILDIMIDALNHNLRRRLDINLYMYVTRLNYSCIDARLQGGDSLCLGIILRIISFLSRSRIRIAYHWSELWRALLSLLRFLTTYASDLSHNPDIHPLLDSLVNLIALSLSSGESFLPDPAPYDDLFYKLVESGPTLTKFRDAYNLHKDNDHNSIDTLINVSNHY
ncbi:MAG: hypothetical protein M1830_005662, partial [Pleopsidium flavum]